ncbi:MAG: transposase [Nitrosomonas sp.]|nr:transposase [Nitrosomonas sp.]
MLCTAHPKIAPGQIVRVFKSITARELFKKRPEDLWNGEFWTDGYYRNCRGKSRLECS